MKCTNCGRETGSEFKPTCEYCIGYGGFIRKIENKDIKKINFKIPDPNKEDYRHTKNQHQKDNSMNVAYSVMILFGLIGLNIGGFGGLILGAIFGFGITAIIYALIEYFQKQ